MIIPSAQINPPPPKSAAKLTGGVGFSPDRPKSDKRPATNRFLIRHRIINHFYQLILIIIIPDKAK